MLDTNITPAALLQHSTFTLQNMVAIVALHPPSTYPAVWRLIRAKMVNFSHPLTSEEEGEEETAAADINR